MKTYEQRLRKAAYARPKDVYGGGGLDVGSRIGTRIVQFVYLRPPAFGYKVGRGKR